jgi:hypothetical protein
MVTRVSTRSLLKDPAKSCENGNRSAGNILKSPDKIQACRTVDAGFASGSDRADI